MIQELMIGDWVHPDIPNVIHCKINSIERLYYLEEANINIQPIPITSEILEKNGFIHNEEKDLLTCWVGNSFIDYDVNTHYFMIVNRGRSYEGEITNIHELQHALRLCKIDKEIKL